MKKIAIVVMVQESAHHVMEHIELIINLDREHWNVQTVSRMVRAQHAMEVEK